MTCKLRIAMGLIVLQLPFLTACFRTVTKYKSETVPEKVTKIRTVRKPVSQEVQIPYQEEVKTPQYRVVRNPRLTPSEGQKMTMAFLPFSSSTGNTQDGAEVAELLRQAVQRHLESANKYHIVSFYQVRNALGGEIIKITPENIRKLSSALGIETIITGHVKDRSDSRLSFRVEGISAQTMKLIFGETVMGDGPTAIQQSLEVFFGKKVLSGYTTEVITKYRMETQTLTRDVQETYIETENRTKDVAYQERKRTLIGSILYYLAIPVGSTLFVLLVSH